MYNSNYKDTSLPQKRFRKRVEGFICEICDTKVKGTGYTDHCPNCLWSKHVDTNPGDRLEKCRGMMKPIGCTKTKSRYTIHYICTTCRKKHSVRSSPEDNTEVLIELSTLAVSD